MAPDDDLARLRAEMDQAREGMKEFAGNVWAFYGALVEQGFTAPQALKLTQTWLAAMVGGIGGGDGE